MPSAASLRDREHRNCRKSADLIADPLTPKAVHSARCAAWERIVIFSVEWTELLGDWRLIPDRAKRVRKLFNNRVRTRVADWKILYPIEDDRGVVLILDAVHVVYGVCRDQAYRARQGRKLRRRLRACRRGPDRAPRRVRADPAHHSPTRASVAEIVYHSTRS